MGTARILGVVSGLAALQVGAVAQAAEPVQASLAAPAPSLVERELAFIGFAQNETLCAWAQTLRRPHGTLVDTASTVVVVHMANHRVLATYKLGAPRRTLRHGQFVNADAGVLSRSQPEYQRAMPQAAWAHLKHRAKFAKIQSQFTNATIRLAPDDDVQMQVKVSDRALHVAAQAPSPLGFAVIARLIDGALVTLGHFRLGPLPPPLKAEVRTYFSRSGRSIAVLVHFIGDQVPLQEQYQTAMGQTPGSPLADFHIGLRNRAEQNDQGLQDLFKDMHPNGAADWDEHIGKLF